jgi:hypothetical protein
MIEVSLLSFLTIRIFFDRLHLLKKISNFVFMHYEIQINKFHTVIYIQKNLTESLYFMDLIIIIIIIH